VTRRFLASFALATLAATSIPGLSVGSSARAATGPLVADGGASSAVVIGDNAVVLGSGFGGAEPYTFQWATSAGIVHSADNAATGIDTTDLAAGQYRATLVITDAAGATATDTVDFLVAAPPEEGEEEQAVTSSGQVVLLDETVDDATPGFSPLGGPPTGDAFAFPVDVPDDIGRIIVRLTWESLDNDYDLVVNNPDGTEADSSGSSNAYEEVIIGSPAPGTWEAVANEWLSDGSETIRMLVLGEKKVAAAVAASGDAPVPAADAGGPYEFTLGQAQQLSGSVAGGQAPVTTGWDLDLDGRIDASGLDAVANLGRGHHLVRFLVTDARGLESQEMTSVIVGTADEIADWQVPITLIAMSDSGINPYHEEFSAATYPDPEILRLTNNFTRHPSEYIPDFPADAIAAPISTSKGYYPEEDQWIFRRDIIEEGSPQCAGEIFLSSSMTEAHVKGGNMYWFPGTKIIGAVSPSGGYAADDCPDRDLILDNNGHGTGSASVSTGNRYGYCPTCLIMMVEGLSDEVVFNRFPFAEITSHSHGYVGGAPLGLAYKALDVIGQGSFLGSSAEASKAAVERGQTVMFAAGNGIGNAFDVPQRTYDSDQTGPAWNLVVGALRRDDQGAITGDGVPQYISSWGDGNLPSACRTGVYGQCAFGGTSAATPYSAGTLGTILQAVKEELGDGRPGLYPKQVVAKGQPIAASPYLEDGELTRRELRAVYLKTAEYLNVTAEPGTYPFPDSYNNEQGRYAHEGYGMAGPNHASRAIAVLLGERELPARPDEDAFFAQDCEIRVGIYGAFDRDGDGEDDGCDKDQSAAFPGTGERTSEPHNPNLFDPSRGDVDADRVLQDGFVYYLHREYRTEPYRTSAECGVPQTVTEDDMEQFMDQVNSDDDAEPCFDSRITSTVAAFRPKGIFTATDTLAGTLPAGSEVNISVFVQTVEPGPIVMTGRLMATDRVLGESAETPGVSAPGVWTEIPISFTTDRAAFRGEHLTIQFTLAGHTEWAYGHEADHASFATIQPAAAPDGGDEFGVTIDSTSPAGDGSGISLSGKVAFPDLGPDEDLNNAGFHPTQFNVEISVDDENFGNRVYAAVDPATGPWQTTIADPGAGSHQFFVRAMRDRTPSAVAVASVSETVAPPPAPDDSPLPTTGGGAAVVALALLGGAAAVRRQRRAA